MPVRWRSLAALGSVTLLLAWTGGPPLVEAARTGDWPSVRDLLERGEDVNASAGDGATALHWASYWDSLAVADALIGAGADVNATTDLGVTPLWPATQNGSAAMVAKLLDAGADPNVALLSGETPMMTAALSGNAEVVRNLLAAGADPDGSATWGQTALMWAAGEGHSEVVRALLAGGADVGAHTDVRRQFMKTDKGQESHPAYQVWVDMGGHTPLMFAARSGDLRSVQALVEAGADVNEPDASGSSPTIMAVHGGNAAAVEYLLESGADPNAHASGHTALHAAVLRGNEAAVRALLAHGADPNTVVERATPTRRQSLDYHFHETWVGATPLWLAARFTEPSVMRLLLEQGADPFAVNDVVYPAGNREVNRMQREGEITLLMAAVGMGNRRLSEGFYRPPEHRLEAMMLEAVQIAIAAGVDVSVEDASGRTAADAAREQGFYTVEAYLTEQVAAATHAN